MASFNIICGGPGPHVPADGILGTSDRPSTADVRCSSPSCVKPLDVTVVNQQTMQSRAQAALAANAAFQALASPTNAQTLAQVQLLTKECNALIRLALQAFDSSAGT